MIGDGSCAPEPDDTRAAAANGPLGEQDDDTWDVRAEALVGLTVVLAVVAVVLRWPRDLSQSPQTGGPTAQVALSVLYLFLTLGIVPTLIAAFALCVSLIRDNTKSVRYKVTCAGVLVTAVTSTVALYTNHR